MNQEEQDLTADQLQHIEELTKQVNQEKQFLKQAKNHLIIFTKLGKEDSALKEAGKSTETDILQYKKTIEELETEIKEFTTKSLRQKHGIEVPIFGSSADLKAIIETIQILPKISTRGNKKVANLWKCMVPIIEYNKLSERAAKVAFRSRLEGEAVEIYDLMSEDNLVDIVKSMSKQLDAAFNRQAMLKKITSFERWGSETKINAMERLKNLITSINEHRQLEQTPLDVDMIMRSVLQSIVTQKIWDEAMKLERTQLRKGYRVTINHLINECDDLESDHDFIKLPIALNSLTIT